MSKEIKEGFIANIYEFNILSTGVDGGHRYIRTSIEYKGHLRNLTIFFADKGEEQKLGKDNPFRVIGSLMNEGLQHSLILNDAKII